MSDERNDSFYWFEPHGDGGGVEAPVNRTAFLFDDVSVTQTGSRFEHDRGE